MGTCPGWPVLATSRLAGAGSPPAKRRSRNWASPLRSARGIATSGTSRRSPPWRGHDVYPALLQAILVDEEATRFWIGHDRENAASARGMAKAGFREVGTAHRRADGQLLFVPSASAERAAAAVVYLSLPMTDL